MVAAGWVEETAVSVDLEAAWQCGLDADEAAKTIASGLKAGAEHAHPPLNDRSTVELEFGPVILGGEAAAPTGPSKPIAATPWRRQDLNTMPKREFLYGRLIQRGKIAVTVAQGGTGKTALTNAVEALAMATGRKLLHDEAPAPLRVWVWNLEEDQEELNRRLEGACVHFGIEGDVNTLFVDNGSDMPCRIATADKMGTKIARPLTDAIIAEVKRRNVDVLVIDPFVSTHSVNENDNGAVDAVAKEWARVAHMGGCAVHLVHHTTKLRGIEATVESSRGAIALINAARSARALNPMTKDEAASYGLTDAWRYFRATDGKANYAPRLEDSQWFAHKSLVLPNGDNVGVVTPFKLPDATAGITVTDLDEVLRRAGERDGPNRYREAPQSPDWIGHMIAEVIGADTEVPADKKRVKATLSMWLASGALKIVEGPDAKYTPRKFVVPGDGSASAATDFVSAHEEGEE